jgi:hypothetical protein
MKKNHYKKKKKKKVTLDMCVDVSNDKHSQYIGIPKGEIQL